MFLRNSKNVQCKYTHNFKRSTPHIKTNTNLEMIICFETRHLSSVPDVPWPIGKNGEAAFLNYLPAGTGLNYKDVSRQAVT